MLFRSTSIIDTGGTDTLRFDSALLTSADDGIFVDCADGSWGSFRSSAAISSTADIYAEGQLYIAEGTQIEIFECTAASDRVHDGSAATTIRAGDGDDYIWITGGGDVVDGGAGSADTLRVTVGDIGALRVEALGGTAVRLSDDTGFVFGSAENVELFEFYGQDDTFLDSYTWDGLYQDFLAPVYWQTISSDFNDLNTAYDLGDVSGYSSVLGTGLTGLIQAGLDGTQSDADRRWSEADIDPLRILGSELDSLLDPNDTVQLEALNARLEAFANNPDIGNPLELEQHLIRFGTEATHFAIRGEQFNANLNVVLTAIDNGEAPVSALFENLGGYVSAFELVDTAGSDGATTTIGVRFENTDSTLANAERLVLDLGGIRLELDGSFPRDVQTVYDWSQSGFSVRTLIEATDSSVDAIRLVTPGVKVVELDATGLSVRVPYEAQSADPGTGFERVLAAEIAGDFSAIMGTRYPWSEPITEAEMSAMTLSEVSFKDLIVNTSTDAEEVVEQLAINMAADAWTLSIDELRLIAEGSIGNTLQDLHELQSPFPVTPLDERVDLLRVTTQPLIDGNADDLVKVEKIDASVYVGGVKVNPGEEVKDYSNVDSAVVLTDFDEQHLVGSAYNDTLKIGRAHV